MPVEFIRTKGTSSPYKTSLGRYGVEDASDAYPGVSEESRAGYIPTTKFEWYLKNHLGSTMLVYGTQGIASTDAADLGGAKAAYDYRAFGEQVSMMEPAEKVTENFTGTRSARRGQRTNLFVHCRAAGPWRVAQGQDDEIELNYFGARYLDPMLGLWISVDPKRQFASPYLYVGNGINPVNGVDPDGNVLLFAPGSSPQFKAEFARAIQYLNNGKSSGIIASLHKRKEIVYVREISEATGQQDGFLRKDENLNAPTIDWDPYSALTFGNGLSQSPALGFLHEADHALEFLTNPSGFSNGTLVKDNQYDDNEERRVIRGSESLAAKKLGEDIRDSHGGDSKFVEHSDERP